MNGSRNVILPLMVAFLIFWLSTIDIQKSVGRFQPVKPVKPKPKPKPVIQ